LIWILAGFTIIVGVLFRPIAFDMPLWVIENASAIPGLVICILLSKVKVRWLHHILVPTGLLFVLLDTMAISYSIG
jgi:hypothetical protein